ncbi:helix-turn-helix domain-containing protein [Corynebacterium argentoratense]|uniref:helix-turn-helix domain-containing protein n=1 Tax=Corynebacterium argentoratense TaxID=42817 RepID=UPI004042FF69
MNQVSKTYTVAEVAKQLHVSKSTVYNLINQDKFPTPTIHIGTQYRIIAEPFDTYMKGTTK